MFSIIVWDFCKPNNHTLDFLAPYFPVNDVRVQDNIGKSTMKEIGTLFPCIFYNFPM